MVSYFNPTQGIVNVTLRTGESAIVLPKKTIEVTPQQDRSPSILSRVSKGLLRRLPNKPEPVVRQENTSEASDVVSSGSEPATVVMLEESSPTIKWRKDRLVAFALALGVPVKDDMTKADILLRINEGA